MRSALVAFAIIFGAAAPAAAEQQCLLLGQNCLDLHNYLVSVPDDATVDDMRDRVSSILVAAFYPDYPADSTMDCTPKSALKDMIAGKSYQRITTPFPVATNTAPLNEYLIETGERYCYIGHASEGNS